MRASHLHAKLEGAPELMRRDGYLRGIDGVIEIAGGREGFSTFGAAARHSTALGEPSGSPDVRRGPTGFSTPRRPRRSAYARGVVEPSRTNRVANLVVGALLVAGIGAGLWWLFLRPTPTLTVRESHDESGQHHVVGTVEPPLNAATQGVRGLQYGGDVLALFQIRDETGVLDVYADPSELTLPSPGERVRVTGSRVRAEGPDFARVRPFVAREITPLE